MSGRNNDDPLAGITAEFAGLVLPEESEKTVLERICRLAKQALPGAAEVSVTLIDGDKSATAAATGPLALMLDEWQYEAGNGPCVDAARTGAENHIGDTRVETRWPQFAPRAAQAGVLSSLSLPMPVRQTWIGSLNIYAADPEAFAAADAALARRLAERAAVALHNAQSFTRIQTLADQMKQAMLSRAVIEQAKGILMAQLRINADEAFLMLRTQSQDTNRKVRDLAAQIVADTATSARPQ